MDNILTKQDLDNDWKTRSKSEQKKWRKRGYQAYVMYRIKSRVRGWSFMKITPEQNQKDVSDLFDQLHDWTPPKE